jgi:hypothetical protein
MPLRAPEIYTPGPGGGLPGEFTLPGSGTAVPAGIGAVLEYNGLFMNVQSNVDRYKVTSMDGLYDVDIRDTRDANTDDDGETPYNSFYGGRTLTISGEIETYSVSKLRDMQEALRTAFLDIRTEYPLHFRVGDYSRDHYIKCKKIGPIAGIDQQQNLRASRDFQISLRASNPRFLSFYSQFLDIYPPRYAIQSVQPNPVPIGVAKNNGNYRALPVFRMWGPCRTGCTIVVEETGLSFQINGAIELGHYVEFDVGAKSLKDDFGANVWDMMSDDSDYVYFQGISPTTDGNNHLSYYGDVSQIQISWRDSWI